MSGRDTACQTIHIKGAGTGINNITGFANISIYPNPTTQEVIIDNAEAGTVLDVYNITGTENIWFHLRLKSLLP